MQLSNKTGLTNALTLTLFRDILTMLRDFFLLLTYIDMIMEL